MPIASKAPQRKIIREIHRALENHGATPELLRKVSKERALNRAFMDDSYRVARVAWC
jgi:hypothetical protein